VGGEKGDCEEVRGKGERRRGEVKDVEIVDRGKLSFS
jgi:hypothetical protein